jgi:hypothetical protein
MRGWSYYSGHYIADKSGEQLNRKVPDLRRKSHELSCERYGGCLFLYEVLQLVSRFPGQERDLGMGRPFRIQCGPKSRDLQPDR